MISKLQRFFKYLFRSFFFLGMTALNLTLLNAQQAEVQNVGVIQNARIIIGDGSVIENGSLYFENGEIIQVSTTRLQPPSAVIFDASG